MFPGVEVRHLRAVNVLAEELNFTRAAERLHITQSGFSKQINEVEASTDFTCSFAKTKKMWNSPKWAASSSKKLVWRFYT